MAEGSPEVKAAAHGTGSVADATTTYDDNLIDFPLNFEPQCLLLPHYGDSPKVGYVVRGRVIVGVLLPGETKERIILIQEGDVFAIPKATYTWWYNDGDSTFSIVYLGDASGGLDKAGLITYFFAAGPAALYNGFSSELLARACGISEEAARKLFESQTNPEIVELEHKLSVKPREGDREGIVLNVASARFGSHVERGGVVVSVTKENLAALMDGQFKFSVNFTKLEANAMRMPGFFDAVQLVHVTRGSGKVEISGVNGASDFDAEVKEGSVFVVKKCYVMAAIAGSEGMEWISIVNTERPVFNPVVGKTSPVNLTHAEVLATALNVSPESVKLARCRGDSRDLILPALN